MDESLDRARALLLTAKRVAVLTGAGISAESGIPTFRDAMSAAGPPQGARPPGGERRVATIGGDHTAGLWSQFRPEDLATSEAFAANPKTVWEWYAWRRERVAKVAPNAGHTALVALEQRTPHFTLITQNVDGLHERSDFPADRLVNIHGTDSVVACMRCGRREPRAAAQRAWEAGAAVPRCGCGGPWKPATISFGPSLVQEDLDRALRAAAASDLLVAAGTSLVVGPINQMVPMARRGRARIAILTASETPYDAVADWKLTDPVEAVLPALADRVGAGPGAA
jgi:NAD-dependent deacetylase